MFRFPQIDTGLQLTDAAGRVSALFQRWWNFDLKNLLEAQEKRQDETITSLEAVVADLQAAVERLERGDIRNSWTTGLTISATAGVTEATVTISAHTRQYGDAGVAVTGGQVTIPNGATRYLYYDDADRSGGTVTYAATDNPADALTTAVNPRRHFVGQVTAPAAQGDPPAPGVGGTPPTYRDDQNTLTDPPSEL